MAAQEQGGQMLGYLPSGASAATSTLQLAATATWLGLSFVPDANRTLNKVRVFCSAVAGTLGGSDLTCDIYSDSTSGSPNASLASSATVTATPTGAAWVEFTGFSLSVTGGTRYWVVLKNSNGTPATNAPTYRFGAASTMPLHIGCTNHQQGWSKKHSTNSGSSWATNVNATVGLRLEYADGYQGTPFEQIANTGSGVGVYSTREFGVKLTTPANAKLNIRGAAFWIATSGTPTGHLRVRLYNDTTLLATSLSVPRLTLVSTMHILSFLFAATQTIDPGTVIRIVISEETQSDTSANRYNSITYTVENDANSRGLVPFGAVQTYYDGSSWADTDTSLIPFALILDTDGEFTSSGGGGTTFLGGVME